MALFERTGRIFDGDIPANGTVDTADFRAKQGAMWLKFWSNVDDECTVQLFRRDAAGDERAHDDKVTIDETEEDKQTVEKPGSWGYFLRFTNATGTPIGCVVDVDQGGVG